ncbi:hypothetical protein ACFOWE_08400, partial [Planomonospora corallina]
APEVPEVPETAVADAPEAVTADTPGSTAGDAPEAAVEVPRAAPVSGAVALEEPASEPEAVPASEAAPELEVTPEPEPEAAPEAEMTPEAEAAPELEMTPELEAVPEPGAAAEPEAAEAAEADGAPAPVPAAAGADEPASPASVDLHELMEGAFADLEDLSWAVAQNRVFTDDPAAVESLAKLFAVRPEVVEEAEQELRARLRDWLASGEAAPYRAHLAALRKTLGKAAPLERLIGAADWHTRELRSLDVPAWQFVLATLGDHYLVDGWLVDGDIAELRHRTRDLIAGAERPPTVGRALELVSSLGIHPEVAKEWLENVPQLRILGAGEAVRHAGGPGARQAPAAGPGREADAAPAPPPGTAPDAGPDAAFPWGPVPESSPSPERTSSAFTSFESRSFESFESRSFEYFASLGSGSGSLGSSESSAASAARPLKDVSLTRRCFRQPDGRWWLRVDITADHLAGVECPLPSGFAAYLGLTPGERRTVTSMAGELTLSWRDRPALESLVLLLHDVGAREGGHLFLTLSEEGVLRARHLPAASPGTEPIARALRLVGYTAPGGTAEQAARVIATRIGMSGSTSTADLLARLRERGDRDLQSLLA